MATSKPGRFEYTAERFVELDAFVQTFAERLRSSFDGAAQHARRFIDKHKGPDTNAQWVIFRNPPCDPETEYAYSAHFPHVRSQTAALCSEPARKALFELLGAIPPFALGDFTSVEKQEQRQKILRLSAIYLERRGIAQSTQELIGRGMKRRPGGRPLETLDIARFANSRRTTAKPMSWEAIYVEWKSRRQNDGRVTKSEDVREAWRRNYGDKASK